ncbi:MAG: hypothetical protein QXN75_01860 [Thermoproteota archaeon]|nr:hypothetical protein [Candidatus Brockarchaeota archaeon]
MPVDADKYTAAAFLGEKEGYFINVDDGVNVDTPPILSLYTTRACCRKGFKVNKPFRHSYA